MTPLKILRGARALIADPQHWGKRKYRQVGPAGQAYCLVGACAQIVWGEQWPYQGKPDIDGETQKLDAALAILKRVIVGESITQYNDTSTHAEVLAALDKAIDKAIMIEELKMMPVAEKILEDA